MSDISTSTPSPVAGRRVYGFGNIAGALAIILLIGSELFAISAAFVYSLVVILHTSQAMTIALAVTIAVPTLWGLVVVARLAFEAETDPDNN